MQGSCLLITKYKNIGSEHRLVTNLKLHIMNLCILMQIDTRRRAIRQCRNLPYNFVMQENHSGYFIDKNIIDPQDKCVFN